tara:strand:- start:281 stop:622 length:342 start_codon:yes stop_codon:yes gene_type:complete
MLQDLSDKSLSRAQDFSWKKNAKEIFKLYDVDTSKPMENFEKHYDLSAYRTLVSICDMFPTPNIDTIGALLRFNYLDLLDWAINIGSKDNATKDFLFPFIDWYKSKHEELSKQ